jgi:pimeloyl-ACP methyl ester carboxylesterase
MGIPTYHNIISKFINMPFFKSSAGKVYYEIHGEGEPLVFVHGRTLDSRMWKPQIEYFKSKYKCIVYDLNGFGKSQIPTQDYCRELTLKELLIHLNIKKANFVGLSLGAKVLLQLVVKDSSRFKSIVLMSPAVPGRKFSKNFIKDWELIENSGKDANFDLAKQYWLNCKAFSMLKTNNLNNYNLLKEIINDYSCWDLHNAPQSLPYSTNAETDYKKINIPTLIGYGDKDYDDFQDNAKYLHQTILGSKIFQVKNSSHMINLEYADIVNENINRFLNN